MTVHQPAYVHGGHPFPGVGLGVKSLHRVEAAGAVIASCNIQHAVQHGHASAAASAQHVGNGRPHVALFIKAMSVTPSSELDERNSVCVTWGSYFSTVARCEELS